jgi:hypothetical protein
MSIIDRYIRKSKTTQLEQTDYFSFIFAKLFRNILGCRICLSLKIFSKHENDMTINLHVQVMTYVISFFLNYYLLRLYFW